MMQAYRLNSIIKKEKTVLQVGAFISAVCALTLSQCILTPPCTSCDFAHAHRVSIDCKRYVHCSNGIPGAYQNCGYNKVFSTRHKTCVPQLTATLSGECPIGTHHVYADKQPSLLTTNYARYPNTGNGYRLTTSFTNGNGYYGYNWQSSTRFPFSSLWRRQYPSFFRRSNDRFFSHPKFNRFGSSPAGTGNIRVNLGFPSKLGNHQLSENCGVKASNWIVGGMEAGPGKWAWQVSVQKLEASSGQWVHVCGGALVHRSWVVTAGHCIHALSRAISVTVVLGSYNLTLAEPGEVRVKVAKLIGHPGYKHGGNYPNDVGLVYLASPLRMTRSINTVCLPKQEESVHSKSRTLHGPNSRCWVTGWGRTLGATDAHVLNEAEVTLIDREKCATSWSGYITPSHICAAGRAGAGACEGDSGGPLTCIHGGRYYLEGVVSWGEDSCRLAGYPSVFTRLALFTDWITQTVTSVPAFH